jgi:apolipoprotein D and lipocalin family protein
LNALVTPVFSLHLINGFTQNHHKSPAMKILLLFFALIALAALVLSFSTCKSGLPTDRPVVKDVDIARYAGTWYEIARYPHRFERGLVGVTATYTPRADGKLDVLNQGYKGSLDGELSRATAFAKQPDPKVGGWLKVYFTRFFGAAYFIMELDQVDYQYALVGSSSMNYLWILSRTPQMDDTLYNRLTQRAEELGYDLSKLEKVPQRLEP